MIPSGRTSVLSGSRNEAVCFRSTVISVSTSDPACSFSLAFVLPFSRSHPHPSQSHHWILVYQVCIWLQIIGNPTNSNKLNRKSGVGRSGLSSYHRGSILFGMFSNILCPLVYCLIVTRWLLNCQVPCLLSKQEEASTRCNANIKKAKLSQRCPAFIHWLEFCHVAPTAARESGKDSV